MACSVELAKTIWTQADAILSNQQLERFFNPSKFNFARNEMEIIANQKLLRLDRVVVFDDEVWVLDYKRQLLDSERAAYRAQLQQYSSVLQTIYPQQKILTGLILADGNLVELAA